jgi:hypothetical protein
VGAEYKDFKDSLGLLDDYGHWISSYRGEMRRILGHKPNSCITEEIQTLWHELAVFLSAQ